MKRLIALLAVVAVPLVLTSAPAAEATLKMQKDAKAAGFAEATNCQYCHNEKLPKKDAVTHNDRGKWLVEQKDAKKAKEVDVNWLKDYTPPKK